MDDKENPREEMEEIALTNGATVFGVGRVGDLLDSFPLLSDPLRCGLDTAISIGIRLSDRILDEIEDGPTQLYYLHYRRVNLSLDHVAIVLAGRIQKEGYSAVPFPASQTIDWEHQRGHLSHKVIGQRAGHGWIGRNNLLVHPSYGAALRYTTILTDMPIPPDRPASGQCGPCRRCLEACPAGAIADSVEDFDRMACLEQLKSFSKSRQIRHYICGICVRACRGRPIGGPAAGG